MTPTPQTRNVREPFYGNGSAQSPNLCGGGDASNIDKHEDFSTFNDDDAQRSRCCRYQGAV